jgi:recombination protein RecR
VTAHMIAGIVRKHFPEVRVTRLSKGLPTGVELEYADVASIASAVFSRR